MIYFMAESAQFQNFRKDHVDKARPTENPAHFAKKQEKAQTAYNRRKLENPWLSYDPELDSSLQAMETVAPDEESQREDAIYELKEEVWNLVEDARYVTDSKTEFTLEWLEGVADKISSHVKRNTDVDFSNHSFRLLTYVSDLYEEPKHHLHDNHEDQAIDTSYSSGLLFMYDLAKKMGQFPNRWINEQRYGIPTDLEWLRINDPLVQLIAESGKFSDPAEADAWIANIATKMDSEQWTKEDIQAECVASSLSEPVVKDLILGITNSQTPINLYAPDLAVLASLADRIALPLPLPENDNIREDVQKTISRYLSDYDSTRYTSQSGSYLKSYSHLFGVELPSEILDVDLPDLAKSYYDEAVTGAEFTETQLHFLGLYKDKFAAGTPAQEKFLVRVFEDFYSHNSDHDNPAKELQTQIETMGNFAERFLGVQIEYTDEVKSVLAKGTNDLLTNLNPVGYRSKSVEEYFAILEESIGSSHVDGIDFGSICVTNCKNPDYFNNNMSGVVNEYKALAEKLGYDFVLQPDQKQALVETYLRNYSFNGWNDKAESLRDGLDQLTDELDFSAQPEALQEIIINKTLSISKSKPKLFDSMREVFQTDLPQDELNQLYKYWVTKYIDNPHEHDSLLEAAISHQEFADPEYVWDQKTINELYWRFLRSKKENYKNIPQLEQVTGIKANFDDEDQLSWIYIQALRSGDFPAIESIHSLTEHKPNLQNPKVAEAFKKYIEDLFDKNRDYSKNEQLKMVEKYIGTALDYSQEDLHSLMKKVLLMNSSQYVSLGEALQPMVGKPLDFKEVGGDVQAKYHTILNPRNEALAISCKNIEMFTGIKPEWNKEEIITILIDNLSNTAFASKVVSVTGISLKYEPESPIAQKARETYLKKSLLGSKNEGQQVQELFGGEIKISSADAVQFLKDTYLTKNVNLGKLLSAMAIGESGGVFKLGTAEINDLMRTWSEALGSSTPDTLLVRKACEDYNFQLSNLPQNFQERFFAQLLLPAYQKEYEFFKNQNGLPVVGDVFKTEIHKYSASQPPAAIEAMLLGVEKDFNSISMGVKTDAFNTIAGQLKSNTDFFEMERWNNLLVKTAPNPQALKDFYADFVSKVQLNSANIEKYMRYVLLAEKKIDLLENKTALLDSFMRNPIGAISFFEALDKSATGNTDLAEASKVFKKDAWVDAFIKLTKLQRRTANTEHDPWIQELPLLLNYVKSLPELSFDNPKQARAFTQYFERFGMLNLPGAFSIYFALGSSDLEKLDPKIVKTLGDIGITTHRQNGKPRELQDIFKDFESYCTEFRTRLVRDEMPKGINSTLGREYFEYLRGSSSHSKSGYSTQEVITKFEKTQKDHPNFFELPGHLQSGSFIVESKKQAAPTAVDRVAEEEIARTLRSNQSKELFVTPVAQFYEALKNPQTLEQQQRAVLDALQVKADKLQKLIPNPLPEEVDTKTRGIIANLIDVRTTIEDITHYREYAAGELRASPSENNEFILAFQNKEGSTFDEVAFLMSLNAHKNHIKMDVLRSVALQFFMSSQGEDFKQRLQVLYNQSQEPTSTNVREFSEMLYNNVLEHFLFESPNAAEVLNHSGHLPFDTDTRQSISKALGVGMFQEGKRKVIPIDALLDRIKNLEEPEELDSKRYEKVSMLPVAGIGRVMAPFSGDMCASKLDHELAEGEYQGLNAYLYVTNEGTPNERIVGSVFVMNTHSEDGKPTILYRANNPRQNFIKDVDADEFVRQSVSHLVEDTRRLWRSHEPRETVRLVTPIDGFGQSATNRPEIYEATRKLLGQPRPVGLEVSDITYFNEYPSYDATLTSSDRNRASRLLLEIAPDGTEIWHAKEDFLGINKQSETYPEPSVSLEELNSNVGREIEGIPVVNAPFRRLRVGQDFSFLAGNDSVVSTASPAEYIYFLDTVSKGGDIVELPVVAPHWRSVTQHDSAQKYELAITNDRGEIVNEPFFEVNTKGGGYTKPSAKGIDFASYSTWTLDPTDSESRVFGCISDWDGQDQDFYVNKSNELTSAGLRCEVNWTTAKAEALPFRGRMRSIDWLKIHGVLPNDPEFFPIINTRLLKTNTRIEEALKASDRRGDIFTNAFETFNREQEYKGQQTYPLDDPKTREAYFVTFFGHMGKNLSVLMNNDYLHTALHSSNISMAAEIMDIDTVHQNSENRDTDPQLLNKFSGVALGHLKDIRDMATSLQTLLTAANKAMISMPETQRLAEEFMTVLESNLDSAKLSAVDHEKGQVLSVVKWIVNKIVVEGEALPSLKNNDISSWELPSVLE